MKRFFLHRLFLVLAVIALVVPPAAGTATATSSPAAALAPKPPTKPSGPAITYNDTLVKHNPGNDKSAPDADANKDDPYARDDAYYTRRTAGDPAVHYTMAQAAVAREQAAQVVLGEQGQAPSGPSGGPAFGGAWTPDGPNPILGIDRTQQGNFYAVSGRVGALAIRSSAPYTMYLGGAQGGVWISSTLTSQWIPKTDNMGSLAIGALALAPSNEDIVYAGTGEGALSGDSYFGVGVLKSIDAGNTFTQVSGSTFNQVSISKIAVHPTDPNTLYVATLRGRGGTKRVTPPNPTPYGIWKSTDGGVHWTGLLTTTDELHGATDLVMDPQNPNVLYASFLGQGISETVNGGASWFSFMNGLPATGATPGEADYAVAPTRFSLGISHPSSAITATLYTGFEYFDNENPPIYHDPTIWKTNAAGTSWVQTPDIGNVVKDYCINGGNSQCFYDNVIGVDPISPTVVYALGLFDYTGNQGAGGIFRSMDGGTHWVDIGYGLHPDYHAIAIRTDNPANIIIGNDGGIWSSSSRGGRLGPSDPISATTWVDLNGTVDPVTGDLLYSTGLQIAQFDSIGVNATITNRFYGGLQDNGTLRKFTTSDEWADFASGDGGQVIVDPTDATYVYGTYFDISPYRFDDGMGITDLGAFYQNSEILNGIDQNDRSDFYPPYAMDPGNPNRLYFGTYRLYRTDNAKTAAAGDVLWQLISPDLTSGCTGSAPNGARGCFISAIGATAGAPALYTGSLDGQIYFTPDATVDSPAWTRVDITSTTPDRPVSDIAVDSSNYRLAYVAFNGYNDATPSQHGHVFKTTNAGQSWTNVSGNLPDAPVNSILIDPSNPNILYAGTDVGPLVTLNGGGTWSPLGTGFPIVNVFGLTLNPFTRQIVAGTHGRGVWSLTDGSSSLAALQIRASSSGAPIGPGGLLTYTITIQNQGNITATSATITDPVPANTTFVSASAGGAHVGGNVVWSGQSVPLGVNDSPLGGLAPGVRVVTLTVQLSNAVTTGQLITNDGFKVLAAGGVGAVGSPYTVAVSPATKPVLSPANQADGTRVGQTIQYHVTLQNLGFAADDFTLSTSGNTFATTFWNAGFTTPITHTGSVDPNGTFVIGVKVAVPANATDGQTDSAAIKATSVGHPAVSATANIQTTAVIKQILLVDDNSNGIDPIDIYTSTLLADGFNFDTWNLGDISVIPPNYLKAHKILVWYTGQAYPDPIGPYESELTSYLNGGGRLFMNGQDILDQTAGQAPFVLNYLHVLWDGTDQYNDVGTVSVTGVSTSPVTSGIGTIPLDFNPLEYLDYSDLFTPTVPAINAFTGVYGVPALNGKPDGISVDTGTYKVVFMSFPFEVMTTAAQGTLMRRVMEFFGLKQTFLPIVHR